MATRIKRSLYIGLGGTGMNALLHAKKMFVDTYGEVPPMVGFLGIDTDGGAYNRTLPLINGGEVGLTPNEQQPIQVPNATPIYKVHESRLSWVPNQNLYALTSMMLGAGQVRSNGRFALTVNYTNVVNKVQSAINAITSQAIINNEAYETSMGAPEIHLVFSLGGGTGCGTFINMAYLLRSLLPQCKLTGYAVMPQIFWEMQHGSAAVEKVRQNGYGALCDLDYLMHLGLGSQPFRIEHLQPGNDQDVADKPFDSVMLVDHMNRSHTVYDNVDQLVEMISLALVNAAGELSAAGASVGDNLRHVMAAGSMDILDKRAWAAGMGVCEIIYRSREMSQIYAIKAAQHLIERLFNTCVDVNTIANDWIDSAEVNIRENNNCDYVIDAIGSKLPRYELTITDPTNPQPEVDQYYSLNSFKDADLKAKIEEIVGRVRAELTKLLSKYINGECGVSTVADLITEIHTQIEIFLGEMTQERDDIMGRLPMQDTAVQNAIKDLVDCTRRTILFGKAARLESLSAIVAEAARQVMIAKLEIQRRQTAITIFSSIKTTLINEAGRVAQLKTTLENVRQQLKQELAQRQNGVGSASKTFQIDLSAAGAMNMKVNGDEIQISEFARTLPQSSIYNLVGQDANAVQHLILAYTNNLNTSVAYRTKNIDEVISAMSEAEYRRMLTMVIQKSEPLFRFDHQGHIPAVQPQDNYYIGVPDKTTSRMANGSFENELVENTSVDYSTLGMKDRVIVYRQVGVVPAYAVTAMQEYKSLYENSRISHHFGLDLERRMIREQYAITPSQADEEDLIGVWVQGFVFGLIKVENGAYKLKSTQLGDLLDGGWYTLGSYRDEAFSAFRQHKDVFRVEIESYVENHSRQIGEESFKWLLDDAAKNYREKYSQIEMTNAQLTAHGNEDIRELFLRELRCAQKLNQ